jgi:hypothetical protein
MHVDEGTIHAWLDGEVPPDEGARIEAHLAACAACASLVAEARGLVAASSRILGALDDVPAGVTPHVERTTLPPAARPRPSRRWYRSPQFAAAATLLVAAFGTITVMRRSSSDMAAARVATPVQLEVLDSAPGAPAAVPPPSPLPARPAASPAEDVPGRVPSVARETAFERARALSAGAAAAGAAPADSGPRKAEADVSLRANEAKQVPARLADEVVRSEKVRVEGEVRTQAAPAAAPPPAPAASGERARRDAAGFSTAARLPGASAFVKCYDLERTPAASAAGVPASVQLIDMAGPVVANRSWRVVMSSAGAGWFWSTAADGSVTLAHVTGDSVVYEVRLTGVGVRDVMASERPCPGR